MLLSAYCSSSSPLNLNQTTTTSVSSGNQSHYNNNKNNFDEKQILSKNQIKKLKQKENKKLKYGNKGSRYI